MINFIRQNRHVLLVAFGVFMASMTTLMFLLNQDPKYHSNELETNTVNSEIVGSVENEEKTYREISKNQEDPIVVIGIDGTIKFSSWDFEEISGIKGDDMKGKPLFSYIYPEDMGVFMAAFGKVIQSGEAVNMIGPYRIMNQNGEYSVNMGSFFPITENGKVAKIGIATRNISNQMEGNNQLKSPDKQPAEDNSKDMEPIKSEDTNEKNDQSNKATHEQGINGVTQEPEKNVAQEQENDEKIQESEKDVAQEQENDEKIQESEKNGTDQNQENDEVNLESEKDGTSTERKKDENNQEHQKNPSGNWISSDKLAMLWPFRFTFFPER